MSLATQNCGATNPLIGAISLMSMPRIPGPLASAVMRFNVSYQPSPPGSGVPSAGTNDIEAVAIKRQIHRPSEAFTT